MKTKLNTLYLSIAALLVFPCANAEELNIGKSTATSTEIISHFTTPSANSTDSAAPAATDSVDDADDISGQISSNKSRSLVIKSTEQKNNKSVKPGRPAIIDVAKTQSDEVAVSMQVLFDYNSYYLSEKAKEQLVPIAQALLSPEMKGMRFRIEGHTDAVGSDDFNNNLSLRRAEAVKEFLTHAYGISSDTIEVEGRGKAGLADPTAPTSETNRRVRLVKVGG
ncbi:OmpA family protein [Methylomonas sp. AM2-LC]|uniref:OmpA family protein n=1 Tax=Methylomonas sp. AM2-LC TaxID=3153301 RepID=UPI003266F5AF